MNTPADKMQDKTQAVANSLAKPRHNAGPALQFADNRPEAIAQRKMQEAIDNGSRARQLRSYQEMANNNTRAKQLKAYQAVADNHPSQNTQRKESGEEKTVHSNTEPVQKKENNTGLPDHLKTGMESLSGISLDDVKVHRNSDKPAQLQAHAYAQGKDIHLGPGQEKHLPHEAWHVVQQKQGHVQPTMQLKQGIPVNDDAGLEHEADVMGKKALEMHSFSINSSPAAPGFSNNTVAQRVVDWAGLAEKTAGDNYALSANHSMLYSKTGAAAPEPRAMYTQGADTTNDEVPVNLHTWKSNVRFLTGSAIDHGHVPTPVERAGWNDGSIARPDDTAVLAELNPEYLRIKGEVTAAMEAETEGEVAPTMGIIGRNDCAQWATALQGLIHNTRDAVAAAEPANFNLGTAADADMRGAPAVGLGDKMEQKLGGGAASGHHGATVVATDGTSLVTLEAHVEKNLTAPEFHIHEGLSGFVNSNNAGADGTPNTYLGANGRNGTVTPLGKAPANIANRLTMLDHYSGELASDDNSIKLGAIQGLLKYYEAVVPEVEAEAEVEVPVENVAPKPKKGCFLTTACVGYRNLPDDCEELTVLRHFRDNYMRKLPEGESLIEKYYEVAPEIVTMIDGTANRRDIYEDLYLILRTCVEAIKQGNNALALQVYKNMVIKLHREYQVKQ